MIFISNVSGFTKCTTALIPTYVMSGPGLYLELIIFTSKCFENYVGTSVEDSINMFL